MSNNTATKAPLEEKYNDYEKTPVPETARQTWYQQGMVWLGAGFGLSGLATGGVLADGLSFRDMLLVSIIGSIILPFDCAREEHDNKTRQCGNSQRLRFKFDCGDD